MKHDVSIIIINFNTFNLTCNCIDSVLEKTLGITFEIILIDNASTECDAELFKIKFPQITLIKNTENIGFSKGNNLGIEKASGEFILLLNSDTVLENNAVKIVYDFLNANSQFGVATSKLIYPDGKIQHCCQAFPSVFLFFLEKTRLHKLLPSKLRTNLFFGAYFNHDYYVEPDWVWGTFFMFKKGILKKLPKNKLNDLYFMYVEDMKWCYDFRKLDYKIAYLPQAIVTHFMGSSLGKKDKQIKINHNNFVKANYSFFSYLILKK